MNRESQQATAARLLTQLADTLNSLSEAGIPAKLKHGAVLTDAGYVLPVDDNRWVARTLLYTELIPTNSQDGDDD